MEPDKAETDAPSNVTDSIDALHISETAEHDSRSTKETTHEKTTPGAESTEENKPAIQKSEIQSDEIGNIETESSHETTTTNDDECPSNLTEIEAQQTHADSLTNSTDKEDDAISHNTESVESETGKDRNLSTPIEETSDTKEIIVEQENSDATDSSNKKSNLRRYRHLGQFLEENAKTFVSNVKPSQKYAASVNGFLEEKSVLVDKTISGKERYIRVCIGDLTKAGTDCIVNAANSELWLGGGIAGAIRRVNGGDVEKECRLYLEEHGGVPTGQVAKTTAGKMPCKFLLHTVGPVYKGGDMNEHELLRDAIWNTLEMADEFGAKSIGLPAISSAIFGFPIHDCSQILVEMSLRWLTEHPESTLVDIQLTDINKETAEIIAEKLNIAMEQH